MSEPAEPADAELLERSAAATTPVERAAMFGFDLPSIKVAAFRLNVAATSLTFVVAVIVLVVLLNLPHFDLFAALLGMFYALVIPILMFVLAQIIARLVLGRRPSASAIAAAPVTTVIAALLLIAAVTLAPRDASGFGGLVFGTILASQVEIGGHVATARIFDKVNPNLTRVAHIYRDYPHWATVAYGRWMWLWVFSILATATAVGALLVFRFATAATPFLVVGLAIVAAAQALATFRAGPVVRLVIALAAVGGLVAVWLLF